MFSESPDRRLASASRFLPFPSIDVESLCGARLSSSPSRRPPPCRVASPLRPSHSPHSSSPGSRRLLRRYAVAASRLLAPHPSASRSAAAPASASASRLVLSLRRRRFCSLRVPLLPPVPAACSAAAAPAAAAASPRRRRLLPLLRRPLSPLPRSTREVRLRRGRNLSRLATIVMRRHFGW